MSALQPPHRARVYSLRDDGTWLEVGTGLASVELPRAAAAAAGGAAAAVAAAALMRITVAADEGGALLADVSVHSDDTLRRAENPTIITFELFGEGGSREIALSFQEASGCATVWQAACDCFGVGAEAKVASRAEAAITVSAGEVAALEDAPSADRPAGTPSSSPSSSSGPCETSSSSSLSSGVP